MRLDGNPACLLAAKASGNGARALATILHVAPDAEQRLGEARDLLGPASSECGASAWNGVLVVRLLSRDPQQLRADLVRFLEGFRQAAMPRSWG
jgi:urease accessory protein